MIKFNIVVHVELWIMDYLSVIFHNKLILLLLYRLLICIWNELLILSNLSACHVLVSVAHVVHLTFSGFFIFKCWWPSFSLVAKCYEFDFCKFNYFGIFYESVGDRHFRELQNVMNLIFANLIISVSF